MCSSGVYVCLAAVLNVSPVFSSPPDDFKEAYLLITEADRLVWEEETGPKTFERLEDWITVKVGKAPGPRTAAAVKKKTEPKAKEEKEERLTSLPPSVAAYRCPEITRKELAAKPEEEMIGVDLINDGDYFRRIDRLIREAQESIYIVMFVINPGAGRGGRVNSLLTSLAGARRRGIRVKVILNKTTDDGEFTAVANEKAYRELGRAGIEVEYDYPKIKTHDKLLVVDWKYTVIGAHNWTEAALSGQNETSVLIKSEGVAKEYFAYFYDIQAQTEKFTRMGW